MTDDGAHREARRLLRESEVGGLPVLRSAIDACRIALGREPTPRRQSDLGLGLVRLFEATDDVDALREAVPLLRGAAAAATRDDDGFAGIHSNLGLALSRSAERSAGRSEARPLLLEAVAAYRVAVAAARAAPATKAKVLCNLGNVMMVSFQATGNPADLADALGVHREAIAVVPAGDPALPGCYAGLANALIAEAVRCGRRSGLLEAIRLQGKVLRHVAANDPDRLIYLNQRAIALRLNFVQSADVASLEDAIRCWRETVALAPVGHPDQLSYRANLALGLRNRFEYSADGPSIDEAERILRGVVADAAADHPERVKYQADLAHALHRRGVHFGQPELLREAVGLLRAAAAAVPPDRPDYLLHLSNVGGALLSLAGATRDTAVLVEAIDVLGVAVRLAGATDVEFTDVLLNVGDAYRARFAWHGDPVDLAAAVDSYDALVAAPLAPMLMRTLAAQQLGRLLAGTGDLAGAHRPYGAAAQMLDVLAWLGLERVDQERLLAQFPDVAGAAAACAIAGGDPSAAVGVLEQGRGVLLAQSLNVRRGADEVRVREPELASRLTTLHHGLVSPISRGRP